MTTISNPARCRVLVVDDAPDMLTTLERLLRADGFDVRVAASRAEALAVFTAERFHVVIVDIRLDQHDPENRDGIVVMQDIKAIDPTVGVLVLTNHADIEVAVKVMQPGQNGQSIFGISKSLAHDFIVKAPDTLSTLGQSVQKICDEVVGINWGLRIEQSDAVLTDFTRRRLAGASPLEVREFAFELDELLRKLFADCEQIQLRTVTAQHSGYSKAVVFQVKPQIKGDKGEFLIAKIGEYELIEHEITNYKAFIERRIYNNRGPVAITPARRTRTMGGIVYTFTGLGGEIQDFADFYRKTDDGSAIARVINSLFAETLSMQHRSETARLTDAVDMRDLYMQRLRLTFDELEAKQLELFRQYKTLYSETNRRKFWLEGRTPMVNPVEFARTFDFKGSYFYSTIHGDLHSHNVLVGRYDDAWLIDFANTGRGPVLQDYATFEIGLVVEIAGCRQGRLLYEWSRLLYQAPDLRSPALPDTLAAVPEIKKAHEAVVTIRALVFQERMGGREVTERVYLISLFFVALRLMTVKFLDPFQRFHALVAASLIGEHLQRVSQL